MQDFRKLNVWRNAHEVVLEIHAATRSLPREEVFGLTAQMRRAAVSIPSNISEGCGRAGDREFRRFLRQALGSASELEYDLLLAHELAFLPASDHGRLTSRVTEIKRMLSGLIQKLKTEN